MKRLAPALPLAVLVAVATCRSPVDPNKGKFACQSANDCGGGYECVQQAGGGGFCFPSGTCVAEQCNGLDDNCDGRIDESFPIAGDACQTGQEGPCGDGRNVCDGGTVVCVSSYTPVPETCNRVDDDCRNGIDDGFAFSSDNLNCGGCNIVCGAGSLCLNFLCNEVNCSDGIDNNNDGGTDCFDPGCLAVSCGLDGGFNCGGRIDPVDAGPTPDGGFDAGFDAGTDAGLTDAGLPDAGPDDGGLPDAGSDAGFDAGVDSGVPMPADAGYVFVPACVPRESPCNNGRDDDLDGRLDCADSDCNGMPCDAGTCVMGTCR